MKTRGEVHTVDCGSTNAGTRAREYDEIKEERYARGQWFHGEGAPK